MSISGRSDADAAQAHYLVGELDAWIDRLEKAIDEEKSSDNIFEIRKDVYELQRQIKALRDTFPSAFTT
jgi:hypothetical protein